MSATRLATVGGLEQEALRLMEAALHLNADDPVQAIQEFAAIARTRQIAQQLGWHEELAELDALYADLAAQVQRIIGREVVSA